MSDKLQASVDILNGYAQNGQGNLPPDVYGAIVNFLAEYSKGNVSGAGTLIGPDEKIFTGVACVEAMKAPDAAALRQQIIDDYVGFAPLDLDYEPEVVGDASTMTNEEWLQDRKQGVGASEASILFDVNAYSNKYKLYHDKIGTPGRWTPEMNEYTLGFGHALEPVVRQEVARKLKAQSYVDTRIFRHPKYPWMRLNLDGLMVLPDGSLWVYEGKTTGTFNVEGWANDRVPEPYVLQGAQAMCILNVDRIIYGCGTDNNAGNVIWRKLTRDLNLEEDLIAESKRFWNDNVLARIEPPSTGPMAVRYKMMYGDGPMEPGKRVDGDVAPDPELDAIIKEMQEVSTLKSTVKKQLDALDVRSKEAQARLETKMGDITHTVYTFADGTQKVRISDGVQTRANVDLKSMREHNPALMQQIIDGGYYSEGEPFRVPKITIVKT